MCRLERLPGSPIEVKLLLFNDNVRRLDKLAKIAKSAKLIYTQLEFVDIAGLVKDASKGEGLGNQFLAHIREVDAIAHVLRCFEDENITHVEGSINPLRDLDLLRD